MNDQRTDKLSLEDFASKLGITPARLYDDLITFNEDEAGALTRTKRSLQLFKSKGISFRTKRTRDFILAFVQANFPGQADLPDEIAREYFSQFNATDSESSSPFPKAVSRNDPELINAVLTLLAIRGSGDGLNKERSQYADHYYLVRKSSRKGAQLYYEEPLRIGGQGDASYLIPTEQGINVGFSFASKGICTTVLIHRHQTRVVGMRVIMLFGNANPRKAAMTGVMLRFSDDQYRPVASQVFARRAPKGTPTDEWDETVEAIRKAEQVDPAGEQTANALQEASRYTRRVDKSNDQEKLFKVYEAFGLKYHAKAFDNKEWEKVLGKLSLEEAALEKLLGR